jgi:hypothetical protein
MNIGTFVKGHLLAFQVCDLSDRRLLADQNAFGFRSWKFVRRVDEVRTGGQRENRRRFAELSKINRADIQAFQQLRSGCKF